MIVAKGVASGQLIGELIVYGSMTTWDDRLIRKIQIACDRIYDEFHHPDFIRPDPLEIPRRYTQAIDKEFAALVSAVFALGRVDLILKVLYRLFDRLPAPVEQVSRMAKGELEKFLQGLSYRFFSTSAIAGILRATSQVQKDYGSLEGAFEVGGLELLRSELFRTTQTMVPAIAFPNPAGVAKRWHLFLRWVVRNDSIDLGLWNPKYIAALRYPLDTHIFQTAKILGITRRNQPDLRAQEEITTFFQTICPDDPVRYDFSLSRIGLGKDLSNEAYKIAVLKFIE